MGIDDKIFRKKGTLKLFKGDNEITFEQIVEALKEHEDLKLTLEELKSNEQTHIDEKEKLEAMIVTGKQCQLLF